MENNGITKDNEVIQRDIGEFIFTKEKIISCIERKSWLSQNVRFIQNGPLKDYIIQSFENEFSKEKLEELWPKEDVIAKKFPTELANWEEKSKAYSQSWS